MDIALLATDTAKETGGVWIRFDDETEFLIGSLNSARYRKAFAEVTEDFKRKGKGEMDPEVFRNRMIEVYAKAILLNWKGVKNNGQPFEYSPENAMIMLATVPSVQNFVTLEANNHENFRLQRMEEAKSKLGETSNGG